MTNLHVFIEKPFKYRYILYQVIVYIFNRMKNKVNIDSGNNTGESESEVITISSNELKRLYGVIVAY